MEDLNNKILLEEKPDNSFNSVFNDIALLLNKSKKDVIDDCAIYQIHKIMAGLSKIVVRYGVSDKEFEKLLLNSYKLKINSVIVSPGFLPLCKKKTKKLSLEAQKIIAFIDFPFGESSFKSKLVDIKYSIKSGIDGIIVMIPTMLISQENAKTFKLQLKKISRLKGIEKGIAVVGSDLDDFSIKTVLKSIEKTAINSITFAFGEEKEEDIERKLCLINKHKGKKPIKILCNVNTCEGVIRLSSMGIDNILTPFADQIGYDLVQRFNVKGIKIS